MTGIGVISGDPFVKRAANGEGNMLVCPVKTVSGTVTAVYYPGPGEDCWPCKNDVVTLIRVGGFWAIAGVKPPGDPGLSPGERKISGRDAAGNTKAVVLLDKDGNISLNGDGKRLVTYAELNQALQQLWSAIKGHTHAVAGVSSGTSAAVAAPSSALAPVTLDISAAKTQTLRTGG
jgi:hypothetical protein